MKYTLVNRVLFAQKKKKSKLSTQYHKTVPIKKKKYITRQYYADQKKIHGDNCTVTERVRDLYYTT